MHFTIFFIVVKKKYTRDKFTCTCNKTVKIFKCFFFPHFMIRVFRSECIFVTRRGFKARPRHLKPARSRLSLRGLLTSELATVRFLRTPTAQRSERISFWQLVILRWSLPESRPRPTERPVLTASAPSVCPAPHSANGERNARWVRPDPTEKQSGLEQVCLFLSCPGWAGTGKLLP